MTDENIKCSVSPSHRRPVRVLMLMENCGYPDDMRVVMESRSLHNAGYSVTVICPRSGSLPYVEELDGIRVYRYPKPWEVGGFIGYVAEYAYSLVVTAAISMWVLARHGFDVVHSRVPPDVYVFLAYFYKVLGKRFVVDLQDSSPDLYQAKHQGRGNSVVHRTLLLLERLSCRAADCLITINESYREMLTARAGIDRTACYVVRNAPDPQFLQSAEFLPELREPGQCVIGYMGMIGEQDRVDVLLESLSVLLYDLRRSDFAAIIIGAGTALASVKRRCEELGLTRHVRFVGYLRGQDLIRHMASFDLGVTPDPSNSYNDYCSFLKTMEYMALAKPVVCFDLPESRVTAGDAALYARPNDVHDFARQMVRLMDDATLRGRMGAIGRERAEGILSWDRQAGILLRAYEVMLERSHAAACRKPQAISTSGSLTTPVDAAR